MRETMIVNLVEKGVTLATAIAICNMVTASFTAYVKQEIRKRDEYKCLRCGEIENLECSHKNHSRNNPRYNDPDNGELLCALHHYLYHLAYKDDPRLIGLSKRENDWALGKIWERMTEIQKLKIDPLYKEKRIS